MQIDSASKGFIYIVSSASTTGAGKKSEDFSIDYFQRLQGMRLKNPGLIGFGISDRATFENACNYAQGAIVGSAFIDALKQDSDFTGSIKKFVNKIRGMS